MKNIFIENKDITFVVQGAIDEKYITKCINSIIKYFKNSSIIISTWENEFVPDDVLAKVNKIIYNTDPGFCTRNCKPDGKPNNVNRQIVSTINGMKEVKTKYAVKIRSDFIIKNNNFLKYFDNYNKFDNDYRIFEKRIVCAMFGTRKPKAVHYNLPFHIADFFYFGQTQDLIKLFDIPLVTEEEFEWFIRYTDIMPDTNARNRYNAEQSIWINCLKKQGVNVKCEYSTHVNNEIVEQSDKYLVNNFYPVAFARLGVQPQKLNLKSKNHISDYSDYFTENEWLNIYSKYCDSEIRLHHSDVDRVSITLSNFLYEKFKNNKFIGKLIKSAFSRIF